MTNRMRGFTLIELLVVITIIGILASVVLASLSDARAASRDAKRLSDMRNIQTALEMYRNDHNAYPSTGGLNITFGDQTCGSFTAPDQTREDWVPGLVSGGYMSSLPQDPRGGVDRARPTSGWTRACYMYASNGTHYLLSAWATMETGPRSSGALYSRAGFRESLFPDQSYYCNHVSIGNPSNGGDYYQHSFTITNVPCTW